MAYLSLYRKWRPLRFAAVLGQEHVVRTLQGALAQGRVAHAYLFAGPRGTGKTTVARLLARGLNCEAGEGPTPDPCGECPACREITAGAALDVIEIDGASNRGIDEIRQLRENVRLAPARGRFKVYIVDEVHMLTTDAFNALLKTLEEPPARTVFVLATTEPHKVLPTIRSRCQRFDFHRFSAGEIAGHLLQVAAVEGVRLAPEAAHLMAAHADGGMRDALSLLDQAMAACGEAGEEISLERVEQLLGAAPRSTLFALLRALLGGEAARALQALDSAAEGGADLRQLVRDLLRLLHGLMHQLVRGDTSSAELTPEEQQGVAALAGQTRLAAVVQAVDRLIQLEQELRWAGRPRLLLEARLVELAGVAQPAAPAALPGPAALPAPAPSPAPSPARAPQEPHEPAAAAARSGTATPPPAVAPRRRGGGGGQAPGFVPDAAVSRPAAPSLAQVEAAWDQVLATLRRRDLRTQALLIEGRPRAVEGGTLRVALPPGKEFHKKSLEQPHSRQAVERALRQVLGAPLAVEFVFDGAAGEQSAGPSGGAGGRPSGGPGPGEGGGDPVLESVLRLFRGSILKVETIEEGDGVGELPEDGQADAKATGGNGARPGRAG